MINKWFIYSFLLLTTLLACEKEEIVRIENNSAPIDNTIENSTVENYINKTYIMLVGRDPIESELNAAKKILLSENLSSQNRIDFVNQLLGTLAFYKNEYKVTKEILLTGVDSVEIQKKINQQNNQKDKTTDPDKIALYQKRIDQFESLFTIPQELTDGTIDVAEMDRRCIDNQEYDQQNAGAENYVVSLFQNFLGRYPTSNELSECINMYNGKLALFFFQTGQNKQDLITIFLNSNEYSEGRVRLLFARLLYREPTNEELLSEGVQFQNTKDFEALYRTLLIKDEFIGL